MILCSTVVIAIIRTDLAEILSIMIPSICVGLLGFNITRRLERRLRLNTLHKYALEKEMKQMDNFLSNLLPTFVVDILNQREKKRQNTEQNENKNNNGNNNNNNSNKNNTINNNNNNRQLPKVSKNKAQSMQQISLLDEHMSNITGLVSNNNQGLSVCLSLCLFSVCLVPRLFLLLLRSSSSSSFLSSPSLSR
jgi:hypothetical protein